MKQQFKVVLLCVFVSMYFLSSCKKEIASVQEKETASAQENGTFAVSAKLNAVTKMVPIKATYTTTNEILNPPPFLKQRITGIGHSSHLGKSTFEAISTVNLTTRPPFKLGGTATFYAANGDAFYTVFTGTSTPNGDGTSSVVINHTIAGGTGRFIHATGNFTAIAIADPSKPTGFVTSEGYISY